jgi:hypothetical protein
MKAAGKTTRTAKEWESRVLAIFIEARRIPCNMCPMRFDHGTKQKSSFNPLVNCTGVLMPALAAGTLWRAEATWGGM